MRKYLQLVVVLTIFFSVVFIRNIREPAKQSLLGKASASANNAPAAGTPTPEPAPTVVITPIVDLGPVPMSPAAGVTPVPTTTAEQTPVPSPHKWPYLFEGSVFRDGAFTGKPSRMNYGELQIQLVMQGGSIEDIVIVEYPYGTPTSERLSGELIPRMVAQARAIQDWDVDAVSGATQTVQAFKRAMVYALRESEQHG